MKRSNDHIWGGLAFVLAAVFVAVGIYFLLRARASPPTQISTSSVEPAQTPETVEAPQRQRLRKKPLRTPTYTRMTWPGI
jgi:hypothetical protein